MRRTTILSLTWLGCAMLCAVASSIFADDVKSPDQLAANAVRVGRERDASAVPSLTNLLSHESALVRKSAAWAFTQFGVDSAQAMPALIQALADRDARVRWAAVVSLGRIGSKADGADVALSRAVVDENIDVCCAALIALRTVPQSKHSDVISALGQCLKSSNADVQSEAVETIAIIHAKYDDEAKQQLVRSLVSAFATGDDDLRLAIAILLSDFDLIAAPAVPTLVSAIGDSNEHVSAASVRALEHFRDIVNQRWNQLSSDQRLVFQRPTEAAVKALRKLNREPGEVAVIPDQFTNSKARIQLVSAENVAMPPATSPAATSPAANSSSANSEADSQTQRQQPTSHDWWRGSFLGFLICIVFWAIGHRLLRRSPKTSEPLPHILRQEAPSLEKRSTAESCECMSSQSEPISQAHSHSPVMELQSSVPQLLAAASSSDPEVRRIAVASLRAVSSYIVPPFVQALNDDDAKVRHAAAVMLGQIGLGALDAVPQLTSALADVNAQVRSAAAFALAAFGPHAIEAVPHLRTALSDDDAAVRARAAFALGQIGPAARRAAEELARLVSDSDVSVRRNIASALGGIGADAAVVVPALQQATSDVDASVRRCAITAMGLLGLSPSADASNAVNDRDAEQREIVPASLLAPLSKSKAKERSAKTDAIPLHLFQPDEADETELSYSVGHTSDALDFIAQLEDADSDVRWRASQALAQLGVSALPELIASLNHRNSEVRRLLIVSLGHLGREARSAVPAILVALHDVNADVRSAAAGCLGQVGIVSRPVVQALMQLLTDPNAEVRRHAATTLGRFGQPAHEAMTALQVTSISDISAKVRAASQAALQRISESLVGAA